MALDFNTAEKQRGQFDLMPDGTVAPVILKMREVKLTKAKDAKMLDCEFIITDGEFAKRKVWGLMMFEGNGTDGHKTAVNITLSRIRGMLESAYGVDPIDDSPAALAARQLKEWDDLNGLRFLARIGIEKSKDPQYPDKNVIAAAVTPDEDDYNGFDPKPAPSAAPAASNGAASTSSKPSWAR